VSSTRINLPAFGFREAGKFGSMRRLAALILLGLGGRERPEFTTT
jgi:hypothetical protein